MDADTCECGTKRIDGDCPKCALQDVRARFGRQAIPKSEVPGSRIGRYKLREQIGEGGFGTVWVADQEEPVRRRVALKIIKPGMDTKDVIARFEQERQALAMMDHPNIAKVLDAGATQFGRSFFVMELVRGSKLTDYCDEKQLSTTERIELFIAVCQAVQHAHQKGIIHRDLKPSNILVTINDGKAVPKVIDFGVAKATQGRLTEHTIYTRFQQMIGTPLYMSPEQAELTSLDIDTRSDIYSLGVLLYELLTGHTPIERDTLARVGLDEVRRIIREVEPPRPSMRMKTLDGGELTTAAKRRHTEPAKLSGSLRGDLDWIVMKCLEKDRARRYDTANGLALDLQRHLRNEVITARPPTAGYLLGKLVRRNKLVFVAAFVIAASFTIGIAASVWQAVRATNAEKRAVANFEKLRATAPTFAAQARALVAEEQFAVAIEKLDFAVQLEPENAEYHLQQAHLFQATQRLAQAAEDYRRVLALRDEPSARQNLALCEKILAREPDKSRLSTESQRELYHSIYDEGRILEAVPLSRELGLRSETGLASIKARLRELASIPGFSWDRLTALPDGTFSLSLDDLPIKGLPNMVGLPITELRLDRTLIADLAQLKGLPLRKLSIKKTPVTDLSPIARMPLVDLGFGFTNIADLRPLAGMQLKYLDAGQTGCEDLSPLRGQPLHTLSVGYTKVRDLSPLTGSPLVELRLGNCQITDLTPLKSIPTLKRLGIENCELLRDLTPLAKCGSLEAITLPGSDVDLSALRMLPSLKRISYKTDARAVSKPASTFWEDYDQRIPRLRAANAALAAMGIPDGPAKVTLRDDGKVDLNFSGLSIGNFKPLSGLVIGLLDLSQNPLTDLGPLAGLNVERLRLAGCPNLKDLSPLQNVKALQVLEINQSPVTDLTGLRGIPLEDLRLAGTAVSDFSPLRGMPLKVLCFWDTKVRSVAPLVDCPTLQEIELSGSVMDVELLRNLPALKRISHNWNGRHPSQTTDEFWAEFDYQPNSANNLEALNGPASDILKLWTQGQKAEAVTLYRTYLKTSPPEEVLGILHKRFAAAEWKATWFPTSIDPVAQLDAWRMAAQGDDAVTAEVPMLFFVYTSLGPRRSGIHPELSRRGPGAGSFGMIAHARLTLPPGHWRFALRSDDGSRLIINGMPFLEQWTPQSATTKSVDVIEDAIETLDVTVEYFQFGGPAELKLWVTPLD